MVEAQSEVKIHRNLGFYFCEKHRSAKLTTRAVLPHKISLLSWRRSCAVERALVCASLLASLAQGMFANLIGGRLPE